VTAIAFDARRWSFADQVTGGATLVLLISLFLPWFGTDGGFLSVTVNGMWHGYMVIAVMLALAILGYLVLRAGFGSLPFGLSGAAAGDAAGAAADAAKLADQAASTGFVLWERAAQRIAAAASAARAGTGQPDPCRYPALIYVDRPIPADG